MSLLIWLLYKFAQNIKWNVINPEQISLNFQGVGFKVIVTHRRLHQYQLDNI